ncbi:hypothetical protein L914_11663 [Phytophthora nicotianae]|uniref:RxLR effector protein n=2 Tax=Phytophthora nicotianae TaxID=4792 RepID=V9EWL6_PHYNI|nr:hypothetical protein F443_12113 [Phytophthora nicotianae P1569]ETM42744.1 hypothetical protein L914_11663 [Phytophthora nicotianae]
MRSIFYVVVIFALFARSSVVAAFPHPNESGLLLKTSPGSAVQAKRSLRVAGQEVVQATGNGNGGIFKAATTSINKIIPRTDTANMKKLIEKANLVRLIKNAANK